MLVHGFLERSASRTPDAVALIDGRRTVTYGELETLANRFANAYRNAGVRRHDRVVIALENCVELVAAYFGAMKAGGVAVPMPPGPRSDRLSRAIVDCAPALAVVDGAMVQDLDADHPLARLGAVFVAGQTNPSRSLPSTFHLLGAALEDAPADAPDVRSIDVDLAAIIYTSGSTGEPRGVMLTHRNIAANTRSVTTYLDLSARDRVMCVLPFYYVYGLSLLHTHVAVGGTIVIDNRFAFPNVVLRAMQEHRVTGFAGVPSTFALLLHRSSLDSMALPDLRYVTQAGGGMPTAQVIEWLDRGPKVPFYVMYGATEASARLTYLEPVDLRRKLGSIGRAIPNVDIVILHDDDTKAAVGEVGELVARGANISPGYWNARDETARRFSAAGYRTGDLGYYDEEGYLFLVGRKHDMIKVGAHRVGAQEIENVLHKHPAVHEAAVVGVADPILGEVPVAFVALSKPLERAPEALHALCALHLPAHKIPRQFTVTDDLPKIPGVGKIDRETLRARARAAVPTASQRS